MIEMGQPRGTMSDDELALQKMGQPRSAMSDDELALQKMGQPRSAMSDDELALQKDDDDLRLLLVAAGIGWRFFGPTEDEHVDASLMGMARSRQVAKARAKRLRRHKQLRQALRNARKSNALKTREKELAQAAGHPAPPTWLRLMPPAATADERAAVRPLSLALVKKIRDGDKVPVGGAHQVDVPEWSGTGTASLERPDEPLRVVRKRDLRQQQRKTGRMRENVKRKDAYRGFFHLVDAPHGKELVIDPDEDGDPPPPPPPRRSSTRAPAAATGAAACTGALAGGGGEAAHAQATTAAGALGSAWGYRARGTSSPLVKVDGCDVPG